MSRRALAPAKVNLFLHVGAPDTSGYHPICSLMAFADFGDHLAVDESDALALKVHGPFGAALSDESDNLVLRAARALIVEARCPISPVTFALEKRLPVASGLGGGSADAGAALRLMREVLSLPVSDERLEAVAASLGADGASCLWGRPVIAEGRGEHLTLAPGLPPLDAVLVCAGGPVSTAEVYRRYDEIGEFGSVDPPPEPDAFESVEEIAAWITTRRNDLEPAAVSLSSDVGSVLTTLRDEPETLVARVSGSGGACFALCASDIQAESLAERIEALAPRWWVKRCRLGGPWPDPE